MQAAVLSAPAPISQSPLKIEDVPAPEHKPGHVLMKVLACGVCRTDLHIVEGELPPRNPRIIPGHQIVGEVIAAGNTGPRGTGGSPVQVERSLTKSRKTTDPTVSKISIGSRVGVSWLGGTDGTCPFCRRNMENLCDRPTFTGYSVNGGYAEYALARAEFCFPIPPQLDSLHAAPLLCAGIIGFRALRVAGVEKGEHVGLFGFGASAHLAIRVLQAWNCKVYVSTRGESHSKWGGSLGEFGVGDETAKPPVELDRAVTFAPSGDVV